MTTVDQILFAYSSTLQKACGHELDDCLNDFGETKSKAIYSTLTYLRCENSPFSAKIFSNGKIETFYVTYKMGEFEVIVERFEWLDEYPFHTVESFAKWLNDCERKIFEAAKSLGE